MRNLVDDLRFARRMYARRRRFTALLVATIAVGVGAATSIFSLVDVVIWKQLPYRDAKRLYWIARTDTSWRASPVLARVWDNLSHSLADYRQWASTQRSFEETGAWFATNAALTTRDGAEQIVVARATATLAPLLGVRLHLGRWFLSGEDDRGGPHIAVLSFESWRNRYGADSTVIGRSVTLNGQPVEVIGVLPPRFQIAGDTARIELWTPAGVSAGDWQRGNFNFRVYGRLRDNISPAAATREAEALLTGNQSDGAVGVRLERLQDETTRSVRAPLVILVAAAALLLVIACGNVASLLVGESASRETEIATRMSLGATRGRVARQLVTEHLLLAIVGGAVGSALAAGAVRVLRSMAPAGIPRIETAHLDWRGVAFAVSVTLVTALVFSIGPFATLLREGQSSVLRAGSSRVTRQRGWIERGGVFVQCALVVVLLAGATLLVRTHRELVAVDVGFRAQKLLSVRLRFLPPVTRYRDVDSRRALLNELATRVATIPGVDRAAAAYAVPFQGVSSTEIHVSGSVAVAEHDPVAGTYVIASPGLFETMGIALSAGRLFSVVDEAP
ncbi:MAG TPA: ABC transporter permease, partial [Gemmatimonadaceae bacterium]|nr:ABC transporter permease [Gemmatimonadaceae bacterium]